MNPLSLAIQIKAIEHYFHVVLFIMCTSWFYVSCIRMKPKSATIQMKAIEYYFHAVLFNVLQNEICQIWILPLWNFCTLEGVALAELFLSFF